MEQQVGAQAATNHSASTTLLGTCSEAVSNEKNPVELRRQSLDVGLSGRREDTHQSALLYAFLFGCLCVTLQALLQAFARPT